MCLSVPKTLPHYALQRFRLHFAFAHAGGDVVHELPNVPALHVQRSLRQRELVLQLLSRGPPVLLRVPCRCRVCPKRVQVKQYGELDSEGRWKGS